MAPIPAVPVLCHCQTARRPADGLRWPVGGPPCDLAVDTASTGTPDGIGPLQPGDRVEVEVTGVGKVSNPVVSDR